MWREFYRLNRHKFLQPTLVLWAVTATIILLCLWISPKKEESISFLRQIQVASFFATAITAMTIIVSLPVGLFRYYRTRKTWEQPNWTAFFEKHDFRTSLFNRETKWSFTEEVWTGDIEGFEVLVKPNKEDAAFVEFQFSVHSEPINKQQYIEFANVFKSYQASFEIGYLSKKVQKKLPFPEIERSLQEFSTLLRYEKFTSKKVTERLRTTERL